VANSDGKQAEWRSKALPAYKRLTVQAERLIAGGYLAGANTRRVRRALAALFGGAVGRDTVSRASRKVQFSPSCPGDPDNRTVEDQADDVIPGKRRAFALPPSRALWIRSDLGSSSSSAENCDWPPARR